jgi:hypothetical protein
MGHGAHCEIRAQDHAGDEVDMNQFQRVLAPVDLSDRTRSVLEYACFVSDLFNAGLDVVHFIDIDIDLAARTCPYRAATPRELLFSMIAERREALTKLLGSLRSPAAHRSRLKVDLDNPLHAVLWLLMGGGYQLVVIGQSTGEGRLGRAIAELPGCGLVVAGAGEPVPDAWRVGASSRS